ncbi:PucR family transcriptional regulator [Bacillus taeanensis]|uniref:PucR family transcriptional regulator n=1 Tax=Bacillus taeanensis TaxID=273032 RepID=A0A366XYQ7_9BACI|nr:PucR family transcriptional regulator [Bacillus taeanensis]RBW69061.1 PucR family transcriptional regulator [Bacillus taeanensis]
MNYQKDPFSGTFESLETLVDTISEVTSCPVTLEDANHRLLAYSSHEAQSDPARIATIIGRRVPERVINSLWRDGFIQKLLNSDEPIRITPIDEIGLGNRIAISIRKNNEVLGFIWLLEVNVELNDEDFLQLKKAAQAAKTKLLQLQVRKRKEEQGLQEFFWQLLTGHLHVETVIKEEAERLRVSLPPFFRVLVFQFSEALSEKAQKQIHYILSTTQKVKIICHAVDRNHLILLAAPQPLSPNKQDVAEFINAFITQMKERFSIHAVDGACGSMYDSYLKVEASYQEALTVLQIKKQFPKETNEIKSYQDLGFYRFLPVILEQKQKEHIENQELQKLRQYDRIHNSGFVHTLEVFLNHDSNVKEAAHALHVHVNTLNYRLKRISEIANIDLKNMAQKVTLYLDLKTEKLHEEFNL